MTRAFRVWSLLFLASEGLHNWENPSIFVGSFTTSMLTGVGRLAQSREMFKLRESLDSWARASGRVRCRSFIIGIGLIIGTTTAVERL
jgi:hypothetical protein